MVIRILKKNCAKIITRHINWKILSNCNIITCSVKNLIKVNFKYLTNELHCVLFHLFFILCRLLYIFLCISFVVCYHVFNHLCYVFHFYVLHHVCICYLNSLCYFCYVCYIVFQCVFHCNCFVINSSHNSIIVFC